VRLNQLLGPMAMVMYGLFSYIEKHATQWAHCNSNIE